MPFFSDTNLINPETNPFRTILNSWKVSSKSVYEEKLAGLDKKSFLLINLVRRVPSFYIGTKFTLKTCVTTVHLLHHKTNFFIHLCFLGRNLQQLKEHPSCRAFQVFGFFTLVYICSDSSTFV